MENRNQRNLSHNHTKRNLRLKRSMNREQKKEEGMFYLFISPWLLGFVFFIGGPIIASLILSFTNYNVIETPEWVGLSNYTKLFQDNLFYKSLKVTGYFVILGVPFTIIMSLLLAILLNQKVKGQALFRTFYYAPSIISGVSVAFLWAWLLNPDFGVVNNIIHSTFGAKGPGWFTSSTWVIPSFVLMRFTALGSTMIIFLASLQSLPDELYEAAAIDGANAFQRFFKITIPMVSPVILFNTIMAIISSFQIFTEAYVITSGGPEWGSYFYVLNLFETAFSQFRMGYASAQAWILFLIIALLTMLTLWISRKQIHYEYDNRS
ncbi:carbohydrate ABC transporter permease [Bacillus sp. SD088]|uniref:carbohydrate ABC transporter permease n=1 Tax=Bacillus sp. SD088 TaxID=2782012 RepID=UPI0028BDD19A|nr:sugar ABC transporter permease [Bacillus sp. SD088]